MTLEEFHSGAPYRDSVTADSQTVMRETHLNFTFAQNGRPADNWRIEKLRISDATGNAWFPILETFTPDTNRTNQSRPAGSVARFFSALWPGENAWKLEGEFVRTGGFSPGEIWESPMLAIPAFGVDTNLNARFERDGVTVELAGLASPGTDLPEHFGRMAEIEGKDRGKIIALAIRVSPELKGRRLSPVRAVDQDGNEVRLVAHRNWFEAERFWESSTNVFEMVEPRNSGPTQQVLLLDPGDRARQIQLTFALQRSRFVQFLARPEFVSSNRVDRPMSNSHR